MNLLYISPMIVDRDNLDGVARKILYQCDAFGSVDKDDRIYLASFFSEDRYAVQGDGFETELPFVNRGSKQLNMFQIYPQLPRVCSELCINAVYFRMLALSWVTELLFRRLKRQNIRIVVEIPTYPFWKEKWMDVWNHVRSGRAMKGAKQGVSNIVYWLYSRRLKNYIKAIVTFSDIHRLWGVKVIGIANGYHFVLPEGENVLKDETEDIHLLMVASVRSNHGADRVIAGMSEYYRQNPHRKIIFHIVGDGTAIPALKEMSARDEKLKDCVIFHGFKSGKALDRMYALGDIGVSALAFHRLDVRYCSPLKSKEYFAKGLPVIGTTAEKDIARTACTQYYLAFPENDSPIDIREVISFYDGLRSRRVTDREVIAAASEYFDWNSIMRPVYEILKSQ